MCDSTQLVLYIIIIFSNSVYALAAPLLPIIFEEKELPGAWVGLIFSMYSLSMIIVSPFIGVVVDMIGHSNLHAVGLSSMGAAMFLHGFL